MNRAEFFAGLEHGLRQLPSQQRAEILSDYQSYFADALAAGRAEHEVAESLGNPTRLSAELRLGLEAPRSASRSFFTLMTLAVIDGISWLPLVAGLLLVLALTGIGAVALVYACFTLLVIPFDSPLGGIAAVLLRGVALTAAGVAAFALARAGVLLLVKFFVRMHRRNRRHALIKEA
jgi:uncharacterized membrane protein